VARLTCKYILKLTSARGSESEEISSTLDDFIDRLHPKSREEYKQLRSEEEKMEFIETELNEAQLPFSPSDDSVARAKIIKVCEVR